MSKRALRSFLILMFIPAGLLFLNLVGPRGLLDLASEQDRFLFFYLRLPRFLLAWGVGMSLAVTGAVFQSLFRNPLADPHLIGVSAGAGAGVWICAVFGFSFSFFPVFAGLGALAVLFLVFLLSMRKGALSMYTLLLLGVMINSFLVSLMLFCQSLFRSDDTAAAFNWLLGNLSMAGYAQILFLFITLGIVGFFFMRQAPKLNLLSLGESAARSLGVSVEKTQILLFIAAAILTGAAVSLSGMISFVGLMSPHVARLFVGSDLRRSLPVSAWAGGVLLAGADMLARSLFYPSEIPVGIVTALLGVPFFIVILKRREGKRVIS
ncbi:MAG TPA: iron ABC transporter permease [Candidatus Omnitrophota bacterium]|nr:iron ABC transporter permease [Candidatus Omnitrophota bacterium]HRY85115.1 iron ABC transporter permease [Candidatus Omnitrophota bacterium]